MRTIFGIIAVLATLSFAPAYAGQNDCGPLCNIYKHTRAKPLAPPTTDLVCIPLKQPKPGIVVFRIYDAVGHELDAGNKQHSNVKGMVDQFCIGRHYLSRALAGHAELCNDVDTKTLRPLEIRILLSRGMPPNHWVYLYPHMK